MPPEIANAAIPIGIVSNSGKPWIFTYHALRVGKHGRGFAIAASLLTTGRAYIEHPVDNGRRSALQ